MPAPGQRPPGHHRRPLGPSGAEAVLELRAVRANGDFDAYWTWHQQQEFTRNHQTRYRGQVIPT